MDVVPQTFDIIYPDFPWQYDVWDEPTGGGRTASQHYTTRPIKRFYQLPMSDLGNRNCLIMMWTTHPNFFQARDLVDAWNSKAKYKYQVFEYKTIPFDWIKLNRLWKQTARKILKNGATDEALDELAIRMFANGNGYYTMANIEQIALFGRGSLNGNLERIAKNVRSAQAHILPSRHSEKPDIFNKLISAIFPKAKCLEMFARRHYPDPRWTCIGKELSGNDISADIDILLGRKIDPNAAGPSLF